MTRYTFGPVFAVAQTPSATDDPTAVGYATTNVPVAQTPGGSPETDLLTLAVPGGGTVNGDGTITPDTTTHTVGCQGPDGVLRLYFAGQPVLANELPDLISALGSPSISDVTDLQATLDAKVNTADLTQAIDDEVATYNTAHPQYVLMNEGDPIPDVPAGELLIVIPASSAWVTVSSLFASVLTTDGTTFATASVTPAAGSVTLLHVAAGRNDGLADHPTSVAGCGLTWSRLGSIKNTAGNTASSLWLGVGTPTAGAITATFAGAQMNCGLRVTQVTGVATTGTVVQVGTASPANTTPAVTLSGVNAANPVVGYYTAQSTSQTATIGDGYTELGTQQTATDGPSVLTDAEYRLDGVNLVNWTASSTAQKTIIAVELKAA